MKCTMTKTMETAVDAFFTIFGEYAKTNGTKNAIELALTSVKAKYNFNDQEIDDVREEVNELIYGEVAHD